MYKGGEWKSVFVMPGVRILYLIPLKLEVRSRLVDGTTNAVRCIDGGCELSQQAKPWATTMPHLHTCWLIMYLMTAIKSNGSTSFRYGLIRHNVVIWCKAIGVHHPWNNVCEWSLWWGEMAWYSFTLMRSARVLQPPWRRNLEVHCPRVAQHMAGSSYHPNGSSPMLRGIPGT